MMLENKPNILNICYLWLILNIILKVNNSINCIIGIKIDQYKLVLPLRQKNLFSIYNLPSGTHVHIKSLSD